MKLYKIANWNEKFETSETSKRNALGWVPVPNKHDGLGFRSITKHRDGIALYGAWVLILTIASKSTKEKRGTLIRGDVPLSARDMSLMTGFPERSFDRALNFFSDKRIGWLTVEEFQTELALDAGAPAARAGQTCCIEEKGIEEKGIDLPFGGPAFAKAWATFEQHRREIKKPLKPTSAALILKKLEAMGELRAITAIHHSVEKGWQGIFEPGDRRGGNDRDSEFKGAF